MNMDYFGFKMHQFMEKILMLKLLLLLIVIYQQIHHCLMKALLKFKLIDTQEHAKNINSLDANSISHYFLQIQLCS